jgi:hypothetical protein
VKNRKLWMALLAAMGVLLVAVSIAHVTGHPVTAAAARHHGNPWWLLYYASWLAFCVWLVTQPAPPTGTQNSFFTWPVWARCGWGILAAIALGRFVYDVLS